MERDGVYIKKFSDEIVNGKVFQMFGDMKVPLGKMKDGKKEGLWTWWYENGSKKGEETFKNGRKHELSIFWYENGQKKWERTFDDGKWVSGKYWNEDGSVRE